MAHHKDVRKITVVLWEQTTCLWPNEHLLLGHDFGLCQQKGHQMQDVIHLFAPVFLSPVDCVFS